MNAYVDIALRSLAVYAFMIIALRLFGKNQLSQLNAGDVVLLLLISNAVQNAMVGPNTSLQGGLVAALILFVVNYILKKLVYKYGAVKDVVEGHPNVLIKDGKVLKDILAKVAITPDELLESIHEHGVERFEDVRLAVLEVDGNISVVSSDEHGATHFSRHKKVVRKKRVY